jgi:hypothetical protein
MYWHDGQGNLVSRIFPTLQEAWDHQNETNPNTSAPYNGVADLALGYSGYWGFVDLTDGTNTTRVYIGKRTYPELQILIFNSGTITVRVNDPPSNFGLNKYTTGTPGSGYTDLGQNQYVVFYKSTQPQIDTTNKIFAQSPLGSSKIYPYELYHKYELRPEITITVYTGIKAPKDISLDMSQVMHINGGYGTRDPINTAHFTGYEGHFDIYADDPYASAGTWRGHFSGAMLFFGWAEDESGNVKFIVLSKYLIRTNTKCEKQADQYIVDLYDADLDEWFDLYVHKPSINHYSYGQGGAVQTPFVHESMYGLIDANVSRLVTPSDTVQEFTSGTGTSGWTYIDAYAAMNCYDATSECIAVAALGIYTDDTSVSIPSDVRTAFACSRSTNEVKIYPLQVKPFMDRYMNAGNTYTVLVRAKRFPRTATGTDLLNWAKKKYPYAISSDEWNNLLSVPPFAIALAGGLPPSGSIPFNISGTPAPGQTITISGTSKRTNATVWVVLMDPDTYTVIAKASGTSDANGNFSVNLTIPSTATVGKTYRLYIIA